MRDTLQFAKDENERMSFLIDRDSKSDQRNLLTSFLTAYYDLAFDQSLSQTLTYEPLTSLSLKLDTF